MAQRGCHSSPIKAPGHLGAKAGRAQWKDIWARQLRRKDKEAVLNVHIREAECPFYALQFSTAEHRRDSPSENDPAKHRAAHTCDHFQKSFVDDSFSLQQRADNIQHGLAFSRKKERWKPPFPGNNEGPYNKNIILSVYLGGTQQGRSLFMFDSKFVLVFFFLTFI